MLQAVPCVQMIARSCGTVVPLVRVFNSKKPTKAEVVLLFNPDMVMPMVPTADMPEERVAELWEEWLLFFGFKLRVSGVVREVVSVTVWRHGHVVRMLG